jgi:hypothetical protein
VWYCKNVFDVDCQTQGRLKLMIELYVSEKSVINFKYQIPGDQEGLFKLAIQLRKFLFITL